MLTLLQLDKCQCRWPMTDEPPHFFCGELTDGRSYCVAHDKRAHAGKGKDWQALAGMMAAVEQTVVPVGRGHGDEFPQPSDTVLREAETYFDEPGGLMGRT